MTITICACQGDPGEGADTKAIESPRGAFMGIVPESTPVMLFPGFISTSFGEYNGTFNPSGTEFFYTVSIPDYDVVVWTRMLDDSTWSAPEMAPFSAHSPEWDPLFSPDGSRLYFSSHRPVPATGETAACEIWYSERTDTSWSEPVHVPLIGPRRGNFYSSLTNDGTIYFNIWNAGDLFRATPGDTGYSVQRLPDIINTGADNGDPFVAPDESYLIYRSYRQGGPGNGDLWITFNNEGDWSEPRVLEHGINTRFREMCPNVTTDGELFIFASNRLQTSYYDTKPASLEEVNHKYEGHDNGNQNIYVMRAGFIERMRNSSSGAK